MTSLNLSFTNPYYTVDGISRGYSLFFQETDYSETSSSADYNTDTYGGRTNFGFPINSRERLSFSVEASRTQMELGNSWAEDHEGNTANSFIPEEIHTFINDAGDDFAELTLGTSWSWTTLNRGLFPTAGAKQSLNFEATVPGSELEYFRLTYKGEKYFHIKDEWTFRVRTEVGYGDGYGDTEQLPFFRNFRAGGVGSVRGYSSNSLGPSGMNKVSNDFVYLDDGSIETSTVSVTDPVTNITTESEVAVEGAVLEGDDNVYYQEDSSELGGNLLTEASMELVFPLPFVEDQRSMRSVLFLDAGNVFDTECLALTEATGIDGNTGQAATNDHTGCTEGFDADELRLGAGVSLTWVTAIGPLTFTFARSLNSQTGDETEGFEFSLGQVF